MSEPLPFCRSDPRFVGDPIDVVTGANTDVITDVRRRGPIPFEWKRYYNSARAATFCHLGWGHSHHFDRCLIRDLDGLRYQDPHRNVVPFADRAIGSRQAASGLVLVRTETDVYRVERPGRPWEEYRFTAEATVARLRRIRRGQDAIVLNYAADGVLVEIIDSVGRTIRVASDNAGRITQLVLTDGGDGTSLLAYEYDAAGNLIRATDRANTTLTFAFDAANRMTRRTDRRGYSFHFEYDDEGRCIHSRGDDGLLEVFLDYQPDAGTTFVRRGDGGQWIYNYNRDKTLTEISDPYGNATKFILDETGRPVQEVDPNGNITQLHYDRSGRHDFRVDPNGHVLPTKADNPNPPDPLAYKLPEAPLQWDLGLLVDQGTIATPSGQDPLLAQFPTAVADTVLGRAPTSGAIAREATIERAEKPLQNDFDQFLEITTPTFTQRWKYDASGNLVEHQDRDGSVYRYVVSSWNARSQSIDPLGHVTSFEFNTQGLIAKVTDPGGTVTEYRHDLRDRLVGLHENGELREAYHWDGAGNIVQKDDNLGNTLIKWEVGAGNNYKTDILNSGEKHPFEHDATGRIIKTQTPAGTATFLYDDDGNLLADKRDGKGVSHQFESRRLRSTTYFDKFKVSYEKLADGDWIVQDPTDARHRFQVGKSGLAVKRLASGSKELCQFDQDGRCRSKALIRNNEQSTLWMRGYAYSAMGDLLAVADTKRGTTRYRHDAAHRLIEEIPSKGPARIFRHDAAGNLLEQPGLKDVVIAEANRLQGANGEHYTYNHRGDLSERQGPRGTTRYEYDALDMLVRCDVNGAPWTASYDGLCRRVQKTWRGETTTYYWDDFRLSAEVSHDGTCRLYIYPDDVALAPFLFIEYESLDAGPESGKRYYVFTNQVGAPIWVEDDGGKVCWSAQIDPYGTAHINPGSTVDMPLRFPGHYFDQETGLHCNRFRYFSPELGRYIQSDPAGQSGGINVYAYLHNPLSDVDIDGLANPIKGNGTKTRYKKGPGTELQPDCPLQKLTAEEMSSPENVQAALEKRAALMHNQLQQGDVKIPGPPPYTLSGNATTQKPCLAVVVDKEGNVFYGQNSEKVPDNLNQGLQDAALAQKSLGPTKTDVSSIRAGASQPPGSHAEVAAANRAQAANPDTKLSDLTAHNVSTGETVEKDGKKVSQVRPPVPVDDKGNPTEKLPPMPCCSNCTGVLNADKKESRPGVNTTQDPEDRHGFLQNPPPPTQS